MTSTLASPEIFLISDKLPLIASFQIQRKAKVRNLMTTTWHNLIHIPIFLFFPLAKTIFQISFSSTCPGYRPRSRMERFQAYSSVIFSGFGFVIQFHWDCLNEEYCSIQTQSPCFGAPSPYLLCCSFIAIHSQKTAIVKVKNMQKIFAPLLTGIVPHPIYSFQPLNRQIVQIQTSEYLTSHKPLDIMLNLLLVIINR